MPCLDAVIPEMTNARLKINYARLNSSTVCMQTVDLLVRELVPILVNMINFGAMKTPSRSRLVWRIDTTCAVGSAFNCDPSAYSYLEIISVDTALFTTDVSSIVAR